MDGAFCAGRAREHAVARVALALVRPLVGLAVALADQLPALGEIRLRISSCSGRLATAPIRTNRSDERVVEAGLGELDQERTELTVGDVLQGDREWTHR